MNHSGESKSYVGLLVASLILLPLALAPEQKGRGAGAGTPLTASIVRTIIARRAASCQSGFNQVCIALPGDAAKAIRTHAVRGEEDASWSDLGQQYATADSGVRHLIVPIAAFHDVSVSEIASPKSNAGIARAIWSATVAYQPGAAAFTGTAPPDPALEELHSRIGTRVGPITSWFSDGPNGWAYDPSVATPAGLFSVDRSSVMTHNLFFAFLAICTLVFAVVYFAPNIVLFELLLAWRKRRADRNVT